MKQGLLALLAAATVFVVAISAPGQAAAHRSGCHRWHACPSDHHTYPWRWLWCTSYTSERVPSDTKTVSYQGIVYWCRGTRTSVVSAASGSSSPGSSSGENSGGCGVERWAVKTLQDRPVASPPVRMTTIRFLVTRSAPSSLPTTRLPFEGHVFTVVAAVTLVRQEADSDVHLVLRAGADDHMIAESASPSCDSKATAPRRRQMTNARQKVRLCAKARVTGVAFFDFKHGQTGVAPNAIELHPILAFDCQSG